MTEVVNQWNAQIGETLETRLELVRWESHSTPDMSGPPQDKINEQLVEECDFAVAVFWYRLGTPTDGFESGSLEEIYKMRESGKRVLVYFSTQRIKSRGHRSNRQRPREASDGTLKGTLADIIRFAFDAVYKIIDVSSHPLGLFIATDQRPSKRGYPTASKAHEYTRYTHEVLYLEGASLKVEVDDDDDRQIGLRGKR